MTAVAKVGKKLQLFQRFFLQLPLGTEGPLGLISHLTITVLAGAFFVQFPIPTAKYYHF